MNESKQKLVPVFDGVSVIRTTAAWGMTVNAYLVQRVGVVALIDSGFPTTTDETLAALKAVGVLPEDVDMVLYTHSHVDHMGGGVALAEVLRNAEHVFWEGTVPATDNYHRYFESLQPWREWLLEALPPSATREVLAPMVEGPPAPRHGSGVLPRRRAVAFGDSVQVGDLRLECVDGRGHDPFHAGWIERDLGWLFGGDVLLRTPTPIMPMMLDDLGSYRATLRRWESSLDAKVLFPGHGRPSRDFLEACARSLEYCRGHYAAVATGLAAGPACVTDMVPDARSPDPGRKRRSFVAVCTLVSQLAELRAQGLVERLEDGRWVAASALPSYDRFVGR